MMTQTKLEARSLLKAIENNRGQQQARPLAVVAGIPRTTTATGPDGDSGVASTTGAVSTPGAAGLEARATAATVVDYSDMSMDESDMVLED